jgi:hypothetical protein
MHLAAISAVTDNELLFQKSGMFCVFSLYFMMQEEREKGRGGQNPSRPL